MGVAPAVPAIPQVGLCKFGNVAARAPFWGAVTTKDNSTQLYTYGGVITAESDFDYVRPVLFNSDNSAPRVITSVALAPTGSLNDNVNPTNASAVSDPTLWVKATFNGGGANQGFPPAAGSTRSVTVPIGGINDEPGIAYGDWMPCSSVARTDGGSLNLIMYRLFASASIPMIVPAATNTLTPIGGAGWDAYAGGRIVRTVQMNADQATTPGIIGSSFVSSGYVPIFGFQFMSRKRGLTMLAIGDSLFQGYGTTGGQNNPFQIAANALSTPSFPISLIMAGFTGLPTSAFQPNFFNMAPGMVPDVVFYKGSSPNDSATMTTALYNASFGRAMAAAAWCAQNGAIFVTTTEQPWGYTGAPEAARLAYNAAIRASGWLYIDMDAVLTNGASPAVIQSQYVSATVPPHYNDLGSQALATQQIIPILQRIIATRPR